MWVRVLARTNRRGDATSWRMNCGSVPTNRAPVCVQWTGATRGTDVRDDLKDSFTAWAAGRRRALVRSAFLLTGDPGRAEDLVQQALFKIAMRWERLCDENPDAYARTVIYRDQVSWWRRRRERVSAQPIDSIEMPVDIEQSVVMAQALARLTPKQRAVLVLRFYEDLSDPEIAEVLDCAVGTVRSQISRALATLRAGLATVAKEASR
jgi:RNA polymerase sigma-70 factor (sigma-E family)